MKKNFRPLLATLVATMVSIALSSASANIVLNPGFEAGTGADADDWEEIANGATGTVTRSSAMPLNGQFSAYMEFDNINNPTAAGGYFIQQVSPANTLDNTPNYNLSFWAKSDSTDFTGVDMFSQIQWLDQDASSGGGVQGETLTPLVPAGINTEYQQFVISNLDVPDGADSFLLRFQVSAGAVDGVANGMYVDHVILDVVPEPTCLSLLALGGLLTLALRRRA